MRYAAILLMISIPAVAADNVYIDQVGSGNVMFVKQTDGDGKTSIILNKGNNNNLTTIQEGFGAHTAFIGVPPSGMSGTNFVTNFNGNNNSNNTLAILQNGNANHTAAINLDASAANSNNSASIQQSGSAPKSFNFTLSGSGISATAVQDNATIPDTASMSIQCLTPPCGGYSYIKH